MTFQHLKNTHREKTIDHRSLPPSLADPFPFGKVLSTDAIAQDLYCHHCRLIWENNHTRAVYRVLCGQEKFRFGHNAWSSVALAVLRIRPDDAILWSKSALKGPVRWRTTHGWFIPTWPSSPRSEVNTIAPYGPLKRPVRKSEMLRMLRLLDLPSLTGTTQTFVGWQPKPSTSGDLWFRKDNEVRASDISLTGQGYKI